MIVRLHKRFHAWLLARGLPEYERQVEPWKRKLLCDLHGTVVEIGAGPGTNLKYYPSQTRWVGVEPNPYMHRYALNESARLGRVIDMRLLSAEATGLPDGYADAVVATCVLCTVDRPEEVLMEVRRILRRGGRFVFLEHVAAPEGSRLRRFQSFARPVWSLIADSCRPDRDTLTTIRQAGFNDLCYDAFRLPHSFLAPHVAGSAINP